jgi:glycine/D-amino acid oxidase-like deaminating enzyme
MHTRARAHTHAHTRTHARSQGYIWMAHRSPVTPVWDLARVSVAEWRRLMETDSSLARCIEWQASGSMLLASSEREAAALAKRHALLQEHGLSAQLLDADEVSRAEPALARGPAGGHAMSIAAGMRVPADAQINGRAAAAALLERCKRYPGLTLMLETRVKSLEIRPGGGFAAAVVTEDGAAVRARSGAVVAAGVWSGQLLSAATGSPHWQAALQPRRGHLLEVCPPPGMPRLGAGVMEMAYTKHYAAGICDMGPADGSYDDDVDVDITFTATEARNGRLLLGSSREFAGWSSLVGAVVWWPS